MVKNRSVFLLSRQSCPSSLSCLFLLLTAAASFAQPPHDSHSMPPLSRELVERPLPLRSGIGTAHDGASTKSSQAQAFYDQGLAYLHSYVWIEAARSFHQALRLDATLAMADVGLSYAYVELRAPAEGRTALDRARTRASTATEHDRRHIDVRAAQMAAEDAPADAVKLAAYRKSVDEALAKFPSDEELLLQRGLAESRDPAERGQGSAAGSVPFFERALALAPQHVAAHHYLAHAFENTGRVAEALAQGEAYAKLAPQVPHARHMLGHELRRAGRIDEAIVEFEAADRIELEYVRQERVPVELDWHYHHNLDLLATSYQYAGRVARAEELLKKSFAIASGDLEQEVSRRQWPVFLLARGRADEALAAAGEMAAHASPLVSAAGHIAAGEAKLALKQPQAAADEANAALRLMRSSREGAGLLANALRQLQGELFLRTGQRDQGHAALRQVAADVRAAPGPDAWAQGLFTLDAIARTARDAGDWEFAAWAAKQMIDHDANYAGAHYALALVAQHAGDAAAARAAFDRARKLWAHADPVLPELRAMN